MSDFAISRYDTYITKKSAYNFQTTEDNFQIFYFIAFFGHFYLRMKHQTKGFDKIQKAVPKTNRKIQ